MTRIRGSSSSTTPQNYRIAALAPTNINTLIFNRHRRHLAISHILMRSNNDTLDTEFVSSFKAYATETLRQTPMNIAQAASHIMFQRTYGGLINQDTDVTLEEYVGERRDFHRVVSQGAFGFDEVETRNLTELLGNVYTILPDVLRKQKQFEDPDYPHRATLLADEIQINRTADRRLLEDQDLLTKLELENKLPFLLPQREGALTTVTAVKPILTNRSTFTDDQELISKLYVDNRNTVITDRIQSQDDEIRGIRTLSEQSNRMVSSVSLDPLRNVETALQRLVGTGRITRRSFERAPPVISTELVVDSQGRLQTAIDMTLGRSFILDVSIRQVAPAESSK